VSRRFLFLTDTHFRDVQPKSRIDDIRESQFAKLAEILEIVREYNVDAIYHGGDFFDNKRPSHKLVADLIDWSRQVGVPIHCTIGNHDVTGYNLESVNNSGLGVLFESQALIPLDKVAYDRDKIVVQSVHVNANAKTNFDTAYVIGDEKYRDYVKLIVSHNYVIPIEVPFDGFVHPKDIKTNANLVLCGHYHEPFEYDTKNTKWINPGPLCRWRSSDRFKKPEVLLIDVGWDVDEEKGYHVRHIPLKSVKPADQVFDVVALETEQRQEDDIKKFVNSLEQTSFQDIDIENIIRQTGIKQEIPIEIIQEALDRVKQAKEVLK
jgi:exonuclease SbcD